ncbi:MBL fold metallo-hydrolase [Flavobacterium sp. MFBS3-15]|uniref:MBL fold metallo-hydrolase n=1 Tax=Flavobacterium sp. MFBS3-15 TaxID=2989816 RepID=UPI002236304E|nr:MBL fold metallo-hydrolase [Flavobacterium sp. MFBS3-15]MCW4469285.1 MBL fold metallo-hydrolase [Flavobacterium sp. MFBS3-15]
MTTTLIIVILLIAGIAVFMKQPQFGKLPSGQRLERIKLSPNYRDGEFQNLSHTPSLKEGVSMPRVLYEFFFNKSKRSRPKLPLPSQKVNLHRLAPDENVLVWFGHSSYFMQVDGIKLLVDPVFSGNASPLKFTTKAFPGSDAYTVEDFPEIDILIITHDHWDHLDYETVLKLKPKVKKVVTGLGTAEHLQTWGYDMALVEERDWNETINFGNGFTIHTTPARHFAGRTFTRNKAIWMSFVLQTPSFRIFLGGDSGYDYFFKEIGERFGPFDLAVLECGQYNVNWEYIHMLPEQVVAAAQDLKTKKLLPVHWAKFSLALHDWDEPIKRVTAEAEKQGMPILTPMIGEKVNLENPGVFKKWWEGLE